MLVHPDRGTVQHLQIAVVSRGNGFENPFPNAELSPSDEAIVAGCWRPIALWNVCPGRTRPQPPTDAVQDFAVNPHEPRPAAYPAAEA